MPALILSSFLSCTVMQLHNWAVYVHDLIPARCEVCLLKSDKISEDLLHTSAIAFSPVEEFFG